MNKIAALLTTLALTLAAAPAAQATRFGYTETTVCKMNKKGVEKCHVKRTRTRFG